METTRIQFLNRLGTLFAHLRPNCRIPYPRLGMCECDASEHNAAVQHIVRTVQDVVTDTQYADPRCIATLASMLHGLLQKQRPHAEACQRIGASRSDDKPCNCWLAPMECKIHRVLVALPSVEAAVHDRVLALGDLPHAAACQPGRAGIPCCDVQRARDKANELLALIREGAPVEPEFAEAAWHLGSDLGLDRTRNGTCDIKWPDSTVERNVPFVATGTDLLVPGTFRGAVVTISVLSLCVANVRQP